MALTRCHLEPSAPRGYTAQVLSAVGLLLGTLGAPLEREGTHGRGRTGVEPPASAEGGCGGASAQLKWQLSWSAVPHCGCNQVSPDCAMRELAVDSPRQVFSASQESTTVWVRESSLEELERMPFLLEEQKWHPAPSRLIRSDLTAFLSKRHRDGATVRMPRHARP